MPMIRAASRVHVRKISGGLLISAGTAVFSGVVGLVVDAAVNGTVYRWVPMVVLFAVGLVLSGYGTWLLTHVPVSGGIVIAAIDDKGDPSYYQNAITSYMQYSATHFTHATSSQSRVHDPKDFNRLRDYVVTGLNSLAPGADRPMRVGVYFQGAHHVGFYVGSLLISGGKRFDLYHSGADDGYFLAHRLDLPEKSTPTPPAEVHITVFLAENGKFATGKQMAAAELRTYLADAGRTGTIALAANLVDPGENEGFSGQVQDSALEQGATALVLVGRPAAPERLPESLAAFESHTAAIIGVARAIRAERGLLYLKTPAVVAVALGRALRDGVWVPMQYLKPPTSRYAPFELDE